MLYRILADLVLVLHLAFVLFAVLGGLAVLGRRWVAWIHVPVVAWAALVEWCGLVCPLPPLENRLRVLGGMEPYAGDFLQRFLLPILYPPGLTRGTQIFLGTLVAILNAVLYGMVILRWRRGLKRSRSRSPRSSEHGRSS